VPGPPPKNPATRQRRNKSASKALLPPEESPIDEIPKLSDFGDSVDWHPLTLRWWLDIWESPLSSEFLRADLGSLIRLAILVNSFWLKLDLETAREIRLLEREFGLTPLARRRLEWTVAQTEGAKDTLEERRARKARIISSKDPREALD